MPMRTIRAALVLVLLLPLAMVAAGSASASPVADQAFLRLAHLSPDTPPVDVTVVAVADPSLRIDVPGVAYGAVSEYAALVPGSYTVSMVPAGAPPGTEPVITTVFAAAAGEAVTVAGLGNNADLALRVLRDDLSPPPAGQAKVRIINASPATPTLDVRLADGPVIATGVPYAGTTDYRTMPIGGWNLVVGRPGAFGTELRVTLDANSVYSVLLVAREGGLEAEIRTDGVGTAATPAGSIAAGFGGTAGSGLPPLAALSLLALAVVALVAARRVTRTAPGPRPRG